MAAHGPEDREDHVQKRGEVLASDQFSHENALHAPIVGRTDLGPSIKPAVPGSNINSYEEQDRELLHRQSTRMATHGPEDRENHVQKMEEVLSADHFSHGNQLHAE